MNGRQKYQIIHRRGTEVAEFAQSKSTFEFTLRELCQLRSSAVNDFAFGLK